MRSMPGNPYDGHTLAGTVEQVGILAGQDNGRPWAMDLQGPAPAWHGHSDTETPPVAPARFGRFTLARPVRTFTVGFEESGFDESPHARWRGTWGHRPPRDVRGFRSGARPDPAPAGDLGRTLRGRLADSRMSVSLETRAPFLDHSVIELAWRLPMSMKICDGTGRGLGKWALRQLLYRHVPLDLIERPKAGFAIPVGQWLRGPLREWAEGLGEVSAATDEDAIVESVIRSA